MTQHSAGPTVGFDLDLTLIDARGGIIRTFELLSAEFGVELDGERFAANLGPPLDDALRGYGFAEPLVDRLVHRYRELYPEVVIAETKPMPGAEQALAAVRAARGRTLVVTGKYGPNAVLHMEALGWDVDHVSGDVFAEAKGGVLLSEGASIYVGDHIGDIAGARRAGAVAVAVATGPFEAGALADAGADVVLDDLTQFPGWLAGR